MTISSHPLQFFIRVVGHVVDFQLVGEVFTIHGVDVTVCVCMYVYLNLLGNRRKKYISFHKQLGLQLKSFRFKYTSCLQPDRTVQSNLDYPNLLWPTPKISTFG